MTEASRPGDKQSIEHSLLTLSEAIKIDIREDSIDTTTLSRLLVLQGKLASVMSQKTTLSDEQIRARHDEASTDYNQIKTATREFTPTLRS